MAFQVLPHEVTAGVTGLVADEGSKDSLLQLAEAEWDVLVTGAANEPVIAARKWGSGRVVVSAEDSIISNPYQNPSVSNVALVRSIVSWLAQPRRGNRSWPVGYRILPEKKLTVGGIELVYPEALSGATGLAFMRDRLGAIIDALQTGVLGVGLAASQRFVALAGCGGGYSSGTEIGVAVNCRAEDVFLVTAHELTHSFDVTGGTHPESFPAPLP